MLFVVEENVNPVGHSPLSWIRGLALAAAVLWPAAGFAPAAAQPTGTVTGKAVFRGKARKPRKIDTEGDPACHKLHAENPLRSETLLVSDDGGLKNVFVYVKEGVTGAFDPPKDPVVLNQEGCRYVPHVFGIQVGQDLVVRNSDETLHNVKILAKANQEKNITQPKKGDETRIRFDRPEVMVSFQCNVHTWMGAYAGVLAHPFFAVSADGGTFEIKNLPPGRYTIEAWHESLGTQTTTVEIGAGQTRAVEFVFEKKP